MIPATITTSTMAAFAAICASPATKRTCGSPVTSGLVNTVADSSPSTQFNAVMVAEVMVLRTASTRPATMSLIQPPMATRPRGST